MFLFYFSITLAICSSALYHFSARSMPSNVNLAASLVVTYPVALGIPLTIAFLFPAPSGFASELKNLNWASFSLTAAVVGIEFGFLLVNVTASLVLVLAKIFLFKDKLTWVNIAGIFVCFIGLLMLNWKK